MLEILLYDKSKPAPSLDQIIIYTSLILLLSNLIFLFICFILHIKTDDIIDNEKNSDYANWAKKQISPWSLLVSEILTTSLYSSISEELVFRLLVQKILLVEMLKVNPNVSIALQGLLFGAVHIGNTVFSTQSKSFTYVQIISATISGIVSGYVYKMSNSLYPSILAHFLNNSIASVTEIYGYFKYLKSTQNKV